MIYLFVRFKTSAEVLYFWSIFVGICYGIINSSRRDNCFLQMITLSCNCIPRVWILKMVSFIDFCLLSILLIFVDKGWVGYIHDPNLVNQKRVFPYVQLFTTLTFTEKHLQGFFNLVYSPWISTASITWRWIQTTFWNSFVRKSLGLLILCQRIVP